MFMLLLRGLAVVLLLMLAYALITGGCRQVVRYYAWMHPDPAAAR